MQNMCRCAIGSYALELIARRFAAGVCSGRKIGGGKEYEKEEEERTPYIRSHT